MNSNTPIERVAAALTTTAKTIPTLSIELALSAEVVDACLLELHRRGEVLFVGGLFPRWKLKGKHK